MNGPRGFSASDAALEGFQALRRHWRVVLGWAGFNLMAVVAMIVVAVIAILAAQVALRGDASASAAVGGVVGSVGALCIEVCIVAALFRLLLRDDAPGFFYLRVGSDEGRLLLLWISLAGILAVAGFLIVGLAALSARAAGWGPAVVGVLGAAFGAWLFTRLSLSEPITVAERRFGLVASWRMSRGRFWPLFGMCAIRLGLLAMVLVLGWLALYLLMAAGSGFRDFGVLSLSNKDAFTERPLRFLAQLAAEVAFAPVWLVIAQAPLAAAYKALSAPVAEAADPAAYPGPWTAPPSA